MSDTKNKILIELKTFTQNNKYFSNEQFKKYLELNFKSYSDNTIKTYLYHFSSENLIFNAGKGFYSTIEKTPELNNSVLLEYKEYLASKFPNLDYSLWSTEQLKPAFHHLQTSNFVFIYSESDYLNTLKNSLSEKYENVFENPLIVEASKYISGNKAIILRPQIARGKTEDNFARIEKILVDFYVEKDKLNLVDKSEYERVFDYFVSNFRIEISSIITYSKRRKNYQDFVKLLEKYTNVTLN